MGNVQRTAENLEIVRVDAERNLILVKGAVPGVPSGTVILKPTTKSA
jgi:large subunit ribosomal protein L3